MTNFKLPLIACLAAAAALSIGSPALAVTAAKTTPTVKHAVKPAAKPALAKAPAAKPRPDPVAAQAKPAPKSAPKSAFVAPAKPRATAPRALAARPATNGRMVQARLSNGKVVTYNCSLAGNQTKQACKR